MLGLPHRRVSGDLQRPTDVRAHQSGRLTIGGAAPQSITVRAYEERDFEAVAAVLARSTAAAFGAFMPWPHGLFEARAFLRGALPGYSDVWVACDAGDVVAVATQRGNYIAQLFVDTGRQRRGTGTLLLEHIRARTAGALELHCFAANVNAREFYEKHGFVVIAHGFSPQEGQPDVLYRWTQP